MARCARIVAQGYPHHIVQRGNNRQKIFFEDQDRTTYLRILKKFLVENDCTLDAYCLMPNHVHLLITPDAKDSLAKAMQKISLCYTQYINTKYKRTGRLWECRFYSSIVDRRMYFWAVCRYIDHNPVRSNLAKIPEEYPWSSARAHTANNTDNIIDAIWKEGDERKKYQAFMKAEDNVHEIKLIRKSVKNGRPLGDEKFYERLKKQFGISVSTRKKGRPKDKRG